MRLADIMTRKVAVIEVDGEAEEAFNRMRVQDIIGEAPVLHGIVSRDGAASATGNSHPTKQGVANSVFAVALNFQDVPIHLDIFVFVDGLFDRTATGRRRSLSLTRAIDGFHFHFLSSTIRKRK